MKRLLVLAALAAASVAAGPVERPHRAFPDPDSATVLHLLNRLTFGPRPGDIDRVQRLGIARWLDQQLQPGRVDDPAQDDVRRRYATAFRPPAELYQDFPPPQQARRERDSMMDRGMTPGDTMMVVARFAQGQRALGGQVVLATLARHIESERQLQEVMTDFWFNHFNVFIGKQANRWLTGDYVERAIRPNVLGKFADLLKAVAHHPAMLVYLDNAQSVAPGSQPPGAARRMIERAPDEVRRQVPTGLNENYARELLELHTLGVDGGYTQADEPPDGCVDHAVVAFNRSQGDIAATLRAIVESDDFWAPANRRAKVKSPLEFLVSALRASGARPDSTPRLAGALQQLGQPLFQQQVPTGDPETKEEWVNSGALMGRMNMALSIASGRLPGLVPPGESAASAVGDKDAMVAMVNATILGGQASANTLQVIRRQIDDLADPRVIRAMAIGLALGSPEFQRQ